MAVERIYPNYRPDEWQEPQVEPQRKKVTKSKVVGISRIEKFVYITLITMIALISIYMLSLKMDAYNNKTQIAELDNKIEEQKTTNGDLKTESMKQSSYERIYEKAEDYGLKLNNNNVKVVRSDAKIKIKKNKIGAVLLVSFFGLLFFILVLRYSYLMISGQAAGEDLAYRASEKYLRQTVAQPERGKIYDRNGKVLAEDTDSY